ncbi:MAG: acetolactate synthase large subunit [Chloroflexi bacterium]|nr:acetolactate synthase large subunit [Chloroflexota bacterium]
MRAADLLVKCLENEGVKYVFGVPGEEVLDLIDALSQSSIRFIVTHHEQGAAFMADAYGRLTGHAGVCIATLGPGATNLTTGIADATLDFAPLVAITGQTNLDRIHKESHQFVDVLTILKAVTIWNTRITRPDVIPEIVRKAFKLAEEEKPGAVHIELTQDVAAMPASGEPLKPYRARRSSPDRQALQTAANIIAGAKSPLILAGGSAVRRPEAAKELRRFARRFHMPVTHTFMGKGAMAEDDPLAMLPLGMPGGGDLCASGMCHADLVIAIGYDQVEYHPNRWNADLDKRIIHIGYTSSEVDRYYRPEVEVVGDIRETMALLSDIVTYQASGEEMENIKTLSRLARAEREYGSTDGHFPVRPQHLVKALRDALGPEDILVSDVGAHKVWLARFYPAYEPNTVLISNGYAAMGFGLPAAIAAKLVYPERKVMAVSGDGGFAMVSAELETAARLHLPIVNVIWVDGGYGLIKWKQEVEGRRVTGVDFGNPDFVRLAEAYGAAGYAISNPDDLPHVLAEALELDRPSIVAVPVDYRENLKMSRRLTEMPCPVTRTTSHKSK